VSRRKRGSPSLTVPQEKKRQKQNLKKPKGTSAKEGKNKLDHAGKHPREFVHCKKGQDQLQGKNFCLAKKRVSSEPEKKARLDQPVREK